MAGQRQKAPALLANTRGGRGRGLVVVPKTVERVPPVPAGITSHGRKVWRRFWSSKVASAVDLDADMERLHHWIRCVDERAKLWPLLSASPLIQGSHRQLMVNPLMRRVRELTRDIERAEEAFGMTPLSRFRLQLTYADAGIGLDQLRRRMQESPAIDDIPVVDLDDLG